jgi:LPS-assembly protein
MGLTQAGLLQVHQVPLDQERERSRHAVYWQQRWAASGLQLSTEGLRVSDDDYWKDFDHTQTFQRRTFSVLNLGEDPSAERSQANLQPRLLAQTAQAERPWQWGAAAGLAYARVQHWQVLQGTDPNGAFISPFQRSPQVGVTAMAPLWGGMDLALETEVNRFTRPDMALDLAPQLRNGQRWHALASVSRPWIGPAGWLIPKLSLNAATYRLEAASAAAVALGSDALSRTIPTLSVDAGLNFERRWSLSQRPLVQTLEPRLVYVNTPMRDQRELPNFDAAPKEFNSTSIFSENAFSGIDRVSDAHQVTMGMTTRTLDSASGAEFVRGSIAQRVQFRDQTTTPAGTVANQRLSDVLMAATVGLSPNWGLDGTVQYNPDLARTTRSVLTMRYQPRLNTTLLASYRYARDLAETVELRANWPLWTRTTGTGSNDCTLLVTGASRLNYNTREGRLADSLAGLEMDAGCWIMRLGMQRQSTGVTEVVTRLIFQLELSGLTRSRANPLRF